MTFWVVFLTWVWWDERPSGGPLFFKAEFLVRVWGERTTQMTASKEDSRMFKFAKDT